MHQTIFCTLILYASSIFGHTPYLETNIYTLDKIDAIPKIIHQIWVGRRPISKQYRRFMKTWQEIHPDWEYKLWTDKDIDDFPWKNKDLFLEADNPGMKSDIWRYEIINTYGGLYVDCDMECKRSFNPIQERLEFYSGWCEPDIIANGIFASIPNSPILEEIIFNVRESIASCDFTYFDPMIIMKSAGPVFFTKELLEILPKLNNPRNINFPREYFQPVDCKHRGRPRSDRERTNIEKICFAVDYNGASWFFCPRQKRKPQ